MGGYQDANYYRGSWCCRLILFVIWLPTFLHVTAQESHADHRRTTSLVELAKEPTSGDSGLFDPIEISPSVIPKVPFPTESVRPMYPIPYVPTRYEPVLTGKCPVNFSRPEISNILDKAAFDCFGPLASLVGNVVCCPQFSSLIHIFQGFFGMKSNNLVLSNAVADHCFSDIVSILASRGANNTIPTLCSIKSSNLTGGSCPVKNDSTFERTVNTSKLVEACRTVDPLKECCRPVCRPAIMDAALQISGRQMMINNDNMAGEMNHTDYLNDCKGVVYSYLSKQLSSEVANKAFRILSACKVNKETQQKILITNKQAIICATQFGSMLRGGGVMTNVYELCDVDLKDFSIQALLAFGVQDAGCLLRSLPGDVIFDNSSGVSFTCDLSDNIAAPWPSSSSFTSLSFCAPEMSLPALPISQSLKNIGCNSGVGFLLVIFTFFVSIVVLRF
ncbi:uncharacterized GPI-anchored protein At1g61900 isoform X3 [Lathyrus oleraceus]|uniref:uncharacterized GPI-anchored protein At1g61900 isoform X3 n=1 Tax=Pisum sativum TaxID=3888 RepID=UPI0021D2E9CD|nr:uncharacterized GPI-anchored protein At1g61900-like isoform X3 [Pisum sativum]